jgi:hypothetical protein
VIASCLHPVLSPWLLLLTDVNHCPTWIKGQFPALTASRLLYPVLPPWLLLTDVTHGPTWIKGRQFPALIASCLNLVLPHWQLNGEQIFTGNCFCRH